MPQSAYFRGHGGEVAKAMRKRYGKRWKRVFYATANKRDMNPRKQALAKNIGRR